MRLPGRRKRKARALQSLRRPGGCLRLRRIEPGYSCTRAAVWWHGANGERYRVGPLLPPGWTTHPADIDAREGME